MKQAKKGLSGVPAFVAVAAVIVLALLNGCAQVPVAAPVESSPQGDGLTYYFLAANNGDPFYVDGVAGFEAAGAELGVKTEFVGPMDLNLASQMKTLEELIANPTTGGIFFYAMDFNAADPLIQEAEAAGIPVVIGAADSPFRSRRGFIGYDNASIGQQAADVAAKLAGGTGKIGTIGVTGPGVSQRMAAFVEHLESTYPNITVVPSTTHDGSAANATVVLDAYMRRNSDLAVLWWADGLSGQLATIWKEHQEGGVKTQFLATDMPEMTLKAVQDGVFVGSVAQNTYAEEFWGMKFLHAARHGQAIPDSTFLRLLLITPENVDEYLEK